MKLGSFDTLMTATIDSYLNHHHLEDALFLAEIYNERVQSDESLLLFINCLLRLKRLDEVYVLLHANALTTAQLRYLFAKCCYELQKYEESECALTERLDGLLRLHPVFNNSPSAPFAQALFSSLLCRTGKSKEAAAACRTALVSSPLSITAISKYFSYGGRDIVKVFSDAEKEMSIDLSRETDIAEEKFVRRAAEVVHIKKTPTSVVVPVSMGAPRKSTRIEEAEIRRNSRFYNNDSENAIGAVIRNRGIAKSHKIHELRSRNSEAIPIFGSGARTERSPSTRKVREPKLPLTSRNSNAVRSLSSSSSLSSGSVQSVQSITAVSPVRKNGVNVSSVNSKPFDDVYKYVFGAIKALAEVQEFVANHAWKKAMELIVKMPIQIAKLPAARTLRAKVMFELSEYSSAKEILLELRRCFPYRVEGMELLSTALWHLQDAFALSSLTTSLMMTHKHRPHSWCAAGNCYSLNQQHAQAIESIERAIQLDPTFTYAYTLLGHELIDQEELDKASKSFRTALTLSPNDYRAWHGLGLVHMRREEKDLARSNMRRALQINPTNRSLLCQLAQVEQAMNEHDVAMNYLTRALKLDPNHIATRYHRARLLYDMKRDNECVEELNKLKAVSPDEAYIFHLLGKVHRRLGQTHKALLNYTWATEIDPRGEQQMMGTTNIEQPYDDTDGEEQSSGTA